MRTLQVHWHRETPAEIKRDVSKRIKRWSNILVPNINHLYVEFKGDSRKGEYASVDSSTEYRVANIQITGNYLSLNEEMREDAIVHELSHVTISPLVDLIHNLIGAFVPEEQRNFVRSQYIAAVEATTEDVSRAATLAMQEREAFPVSMLR